MTKFLKVTLLFLLSIITLQAQNAQKAKALLDEVSAKIKTYENITIDFKYFV